MRGGCSRLPWPGWLRAVGSQPVGGPARLPDVPARPPPVRPTHPRYDYLWPAFNKTANKRTVCYSSRITAIQGRRVTLERRLYYPIREGLALATLRGPPPAVYESGVEEMTFRFRWQPYAAHHMVGGKGQAGEAGRGGGGSRRRRQGGSSDSAAHACGCCAGPTRCWPDTGVAAAVSINKKLTKLQEAGYNAVYFLMTVDCWVRNIASINADSTVLVSCEWERVLILGIALLLPRLAPAVVLAALKRQAARSSV